MTRSKQENLEGALDKAQASGCLLAAGSETARRKLDRYVKSGELVKPMRGRYARRGYWGALSPLERHTVLARTVCADDPSVVFYGVSAAALLGYGPSYHLLDKLHVVKEAASFHGRSRLFINHTMDQIVTATVGGVRVTTPERTVFDCIRTLPFAEGLAIADAACRIHRWAPSRIVEIIESFSKRGGYRGASRACKVAEHVDPRSESGGESIARANMLVAGFMPPELQVEVADPVEAGRTYRVDFAWFAADGTLIAGELDGRQKYTDKDMVEGDAVDAILSERLRESRLSAVGAKIVRFNFQQASDRDALAGILDAYGVPRRASRTLPPTSLRHSRRVGNTRYLQMGGFRLFVSQYRWLDCQGTERLHSV